MIGIEEATEIVLSKIRDWGVEDLPLEKAFGRLLREPLIADRDFPPYTRVTMDGIAIAYSAFASGQRQFPIEGLQAAGSPQKTLQNPDHCLEVMTGAVLPKGTDTVIPYEEVRIKEGVAEVIPNEFKQGKNAHLQGLNRKRGEVIVPSGKWISAAELGVAATVGKSFLAVAALPKVCVITTGDELVEVDAVPLPHQIRKSNAYTIQALLREEGIEADLYHMADKPEEIRLVLNSCLDKYDVLVLSGGVSKGKLDFVPEALATLGVEKLFHRVSQRPGKPFWFGESQERNTVVFALPGNPVSSFMCTCRYLKPYLRKSLGLSATNPLSACLAEDFSFAPSLTYFLQVRLEYTQDGRVLAYPVAGKGSGDLANLCDAQAFLELPADRTDFFKGECFPCWPYVSPERVFSQKL